MFGRIDVSRWLVAAAVLALAEGAGAAAIGVALMAPAHAQWWGNDDGYRRARPQRPSGGFFGLFGPNSGRQPQFEDEFRPPQQRYIQQPQQPVDNSRAPPPRKPEAANPTTSVVVMGDGMADWLAYGLEDAFADSPEIGIERKNRLHSGLLRYDAKGDLDWWHEARDMLAPEKPNYIVMMLGIGDRQDIRERDLAKEADRKAKEQKDKTDAGKSAPADQAASPDQLEAAPEMPRGKKANGVVEFRSEEWEKIYTRRIDETIAALKGKGVPVFWVGLPSIRGNRSTADAVYLNDLYRARAEKAGIVYIDVWDGFVDEGGKYTNFGPDYEGQTRRLRSSDGVFFTKYGARKLAHYVERELRRYMSNRVPVALPAAPISPMPGDGRPAERPLAGPVVPLTVAPASSDLLLGGAGGARSAGDPVATQVLVKGEPVAAPPGRADDFVWPRGSEARAAVPATPAASASANPMPAPPAVSNPAPAPAPPATTATTEPGAPPADAAPAAIGTPEPPVAVEKKPEPAKARAREKTVQNAPAKPKRPHTVATRAQTYFNAPRPPQPVGPARGGSFDIFR